MSLMAEDSRKRRRRWLWGCTGGCLGFMLISFVLILVMMRIFVVRPQPVVHPETFLTRDTQAFLFVRLTRDDPLMMEILRTMILAGPAAEGVRKRSGEAADPELTLELMGRAAPVQFVIVADTGEDGLVPGVLVSAHKYAPLVSALIRAVVVQEARAGQAAFEEYDGARLFTGGENVVVVRGNNFGFTRHLETARVWVDRLVEQRKLEKRAGPDAVPVPDIPSRDALVRAHSRQERDAPIRFALVNLGGEAAWLLDRFSEGPVREALTAALGEGRAVVSVSGQIETLDADSGGLTLFVECDDAGAAERLRVAVAEAEARQEEDAMLGDLSVRVQDETVVLVSAVVDGLPDKAVALLRNLQEADEETAPAEVTPPSP